VFDPAACQNYTQKVKRLQISCPKLKLIPVKRQKKYNCAITFQLLKWCSKSCGEMLKPKL